MKTYEVKVIKREVGKTDEVEILTITAQNAEKAVRESWKQTTLAFRGQEMITYVNGELVRI